MELEAAWIGVVGTVLGALAGGLIAACVTYRGQQREPRLLMLEKRIETHSQLFAKIYRITECIHQRRPPEETLACIKEFNDCLVLGLFCLNKETKEPVIALQAELMRAVDKKAIDYPALKPAFDKATSALMTGIGMAYS